MPRYTHCNTVITSHYSGMGLISKMFTPQNCVYISNLCYISKSYYTVNTCKFPYLSKCSLLALFFTFCVLQDTFVICCRQRCCEINLIIQYFLKPVCILKVRDRGVKDKLYWHAGMKNLENTEVEKESCRFVNTTRTGFRLRSSRHYTH